MKKLLLLSLLAGAFISTTANAQGPSATKPAANQLPTAEQRAAMVKEAKEKQRPWLMEKAGLTAAQADKIVDINYDIREQASAAIQGLNEADRAAKLAEFKVAKEKKYSEIPLTAEQIKGVYAAYEEMGKSMQKRN